MPLSDLVPRHVRLFRDHRYQAVHIPIEFELPCTEATITRDGDRLIIEPVRTNSLLDIVAGWETLEEPFPDIEGLPPLRGRDL